MSNSIVAAINLAESQKRQAEHAAAQRIATCKSEYAAILRRVDCPHPQDAARLVELMKELGYSPERLLKDGETVVEVRRLESLVSEWEARKAEVQEATDTYAEVISRTDRERAEATQKKQQAEARCAEVNRARNTLAPMYHQHADLLQDG